MDSNAQIIADLQNKVGFQPVLDFLSDWKGVPVVIKGQIHEVHEESITFKVQPPDSICMETDEFALILHDQFISGIQGRILEFNPVEGFVKLTEFTYSDRGFGERATVRVKPSEPIEAELRSGKTRLPCRVVDLSLSGLGLVTQSVKEVALSKGSNVLLKLTLLNQDIEIPGTLLGIFPKGETTRLALSFSQDISEYAAVTRYVTRRRAEIRQEIQAAYQKSIGDTA